MARIQKQPQRTPVRKPLEPPPAQTPVRTQGQVDQLPSIPGSVAPPTAPNLSIPPEWLGAFRPR